MHILHVITSVDRSYGGPIEGILQQALNRSDNSYVTEILSFDRADSPLVAACPIPVYAVGTLSDAAKLRWGFLPWVRYGYASKAVPWLKANAKKFDIVVVNGIWNYSAMAVRRALTKTSMPYVVFTHGMLDPWFKIGRRVKTFAKQISWLLCEGPLLNNAKAVLFTTEEERQLARNAFWPYKIAERAVGYGTADIAGDAQTQLDAFFAKLPALRNKPYLLFLSRIHPKKGCDLLIDAYARLAKKYPDVDLVIAGPDHTGWRSKLEAMAEKSGIADRIHWPGMLSGDAKWGAYRGCMAFVLPSHQENFGIVVAEAMAAGKPVLITNKVNIWQEVSDCGGGLVEPDDQEGIYRLLDRLLAMSETEKIEMGKRAREGFLDKFEMCNVVHTINAVYHDITALPRIG